MLFVTHRIGVSPPGVGGWQRSKMFYDAARRLGPTEIVLVDSESANPIRDFEGAAERHVLEPDRFYLKRGIERQLIRIRRVLGNAEYAEEARLSDLVRRLAGDAPDTLVVIRYAKTYWRTGLWRRPRVTGPLICIDVDDRDDQRMTSRLTAGFGRAAAAAAQPYIRLFAAALKRRLARADLVCFAAGADLWSFAAPTRSVVIPNAPGHAPAELPEAKPSSSRALLFLGTFAHAPNRTGLSWFLRHCWRGILEKHPDARLRIAGYGPWEENMRAETKELANVDFVGAVDDLGAEYGASRIALCPGFEASGSKVKLGEAMAFGRAVVSTTASSRGYELPPGPALRIADDPEAFVAACCAYLADDALADRGGAEARRLQQETLSAAAITDRIEAELRALVCARSDAP